ncbi:MAG: hypothetical protein HQL29_00245 [Candidatus Omnitrophica bacterium]|nr:hypothetical protein [Candidatus Omnitrophota bacterium]
MNAIISDIKKTIKEVNFINRLTTIDLRSTEYDLVRLRKMKDFFKRLKFFLSYPVLFRPENGAVASEVQGLSEKLEILLKWLTKNGYKQLVLMGNYIFEPTSLSLKLDKIKVRELRYVAAREHMGLSVRELSMDLLKTQGYHITYDEILKYETGIKLASREYAQNLSMYIGVPFDTLYNGVSTSPFHAIKVLRKHMADGSLKIVPLAGRKEHTFINSMLSGHNKIHDKKLMTDEIYYADYLESLAKRNITNISYVIERQDIIDAEEFESYLSQMAKRQNADIDDIRKKWHRIHPKLIDVMQFITENMRFVYYEDDEHNLYLTGNLPESFEINGQRNIEALEEFENEFSLNAKTGLRLIRVLKDIFYAINNADKEGDPEKGLLIAQHIIEEEINISLLWKIDNMNSYITLLLSIQDHLTYSQIKNPYYELDNILKLTEEFLATLADIFEKTSSMQRTVFREIKGGIGIADTSIDKKNRDLKRNYILTDAGIKTVITMDDFDPEDHNLGEVRVLRKGNLSRYNIASLRKGNDWKKRNIIASRRSDEGMRPDEYGHLTFDGESLETVIDRKLKITSEIIRGYDSLLVNKNFSAFMKRIKSLNNKKRTYVDQKFENDTNYRKQIDNFLSFFREELDSLKETQKGKHIFELKDKAFESAWKKYFNISDEVRVSPGYWHAVFFKKVFVVIESGDLKELGTDRYNLLAALDNSIEKIGKLPLKKAAKISIDVRRNFMVQAIGDEYFENSTDSTKELIEKCMSVFLASDKYYNMNENEKILNDYLLNYQEYMYSLNDNIPDGKGGMKPNEEKLKKLFGGMLDVYVNTADSLRDLTIKRKDLLSKVFINIINRNDTKNANAIGSKLRSIICEELLIEKVFKSTNPTVYKPGLESVIEIIANDFFHKRLFHLLESSGKLPRFAKALIDIYMDAKHDKTTPINIKNKENFYELVEKTIKELTERPSTIQSKTSFSKLRKDIILYLLKMTSINNKEIGNVMKLLRMVGVDISDSSDCSKICAKRVRNEILKLQKSGKEKINILVASGEDVLDALRYLGSDYYELNLEPDNRGENLILKLLKISEGENIPEGEELLNLLGADLSKALNTEEAKNDFIHKCSGRLLKKIYDMKTMDKNEIKDEIAQKLNIEGVLSFLGIENIAYAQDVFGLENKAEVINWEKIHFYQISEFKGRNDHGLTIANAIMPMVLNGAIFHEMGQEPEKSYTKDFYNNDNPEATGADICILGMGANGEVGFHEAGLDYTDTSQSGIEEVDLSDITVANKIEKYPFLKQNRKANVVSMGDIKASRSIFMVAKGKRKSMMLREILDAELKTQLPASVLLEEQGLSLIVDYGSLEYLAPGLSNEYVTNSKVPHFLVPEKNEQINSSVYIKWLDNSILFDSRIINISFESHSDNGNGEKVVCYKERGDIVASITYEENGDIMQIIDINTPQARKGEGISTMLLGILMKKSILNGFNSFSCEVKTSKGDMITILDRFGFHYNSTKIGGDGNHSIDFIKDTDFAKGSYNEKLVQDLSTNEIIEQNLKDITELFLHILREFGAAKRENKEEITLLLDVPDDVAENVRIMIEKYIITSLKNLSENNSAFLSGIFDNITICGIDKINTIKGRLINGRLKPENVIIVSGKYDIEFIKNKFKDMPDPDTFDSFFVTLFEMDGEYEDLVKKSYCPYFEIVFFALLRTLIVQKDLLGYEDVLWQWYNRIPFAEKIKRDKLMDMCLTPDHKNPKNHILLKLVIPDAVELDINSIYTALSNYITQA